MAEPTSLGAFSGFSSTYWIDRGADTYFDYCPELRVFYNSTNNLLKTTSKESAAVLKRTYTVMAEVDGEMHTYYSGVKTGAAHIGTGEGTLYVLRDSTITDAAVINGTVTVTATVTPAHTLTRAANYTGSFFTVNGKLTLSAASADLLRLDGGGASCSGTAPVYVAQTGTATLQDGVLITNNCALQNGGGVYIDGGTFVLEGGRISGNSAQNGGGIFSLAGTITATGGTVSGNTATAAGGGVYQQGTASESELSGAVISGNTAPSGGGVYVQAGAADFSGGEVTGNTASTAGGGFYNTGTLRISGGTVSGNTAPTAVGVYQNGTLEISEKAYLASTDDIRLLNSCKIKNTGRVTTSGTIANLTIDSYQAGTQVLTGDHCAANYAKYVVNVPAGQTELNINSSGILVAKEIRNVAKVSVFGAYDVYYTSLKEAVDAIGTETGLITMVADDNIEETITVRGNVTVTIIGDDTQTRTLTRYRTCTGAMFNVETDATLEFGAAGSTNDSALVIDGGSALYGAYGTCIVENHGTLRLKDGATLCNGSVSGDGAAIRNLGTFEVLGGRIQNCEAANGGAVYNTGSMTQSGGTISGCSATKGGAIRNTGTLVLEGGAIENCTASQNGGGVYNESGSLTVAGVTLTIITGTDDNGDPIYGEENVSGTISGCSAQNGGAIYMSGGTGSVTAGSLTANTARNGGAVNLAGGSFAISGGDITANTASQHGAAVYCGSTLTLDGAHIDASNDVYLPEGHTVAVQGTLSAAKLTPSSYAIGTPMITGSGISTLCSGFTVSNDRFFINTSGLLDTTTLSLKESAHMTIDYTDGVITGIDTSANTVANALAQFDNVASSLVVRDENGNVLTGDDAVYTGCTIVLLDNGGHTLDSKTFALIGDVNCDGSFNGIDAALIYAYAAGKLTKQSSGGAAAYRAADADSNGTIDATDGDLLRACGMWRETVLQP